LLKTNLFTQSIANYYYDYKIDIILRFFDNLVSVEVINADEYTHNKQPNTE